MGDPECQVIIPRLKTDLLKVINYAQGDRLNKLKLNWEKISKVIFYKPKGYPVNIKKIKKLIIKNFKDKKNIFIFLLEPKFQQDLVSSGGRAINIVAKAILKNKENTYTELKKINWRNGFFRKDIGWRVIKENRIIQESIVEKKIKYINLLLTRP